MKYRFIFDNTDSFPVGKMVNVFDIHRSSYYRWLKSSGRRKRKYRKEQELVNKIKAIQEDAHYSYGTPRITDALKKKSLNTNHKKVARLLREYGLNHRMKRNSN